MIIIFVEFIDQFIDYPINCARLNSNIRLSPTPLDRFQPNLPYMYILPIF